MLEHGEIIFDGKSSRDFGLVVEQIPIFSKPAQKVHTYKIPGRSGDYVEKEHAWDNVEISYNVWFSDSDFGDPTVFANRVGDIATWLYNPLHNSDYITTENVHITDYSVVPLAMAGTGDYCILTDNFNPDYYRLAYFAGPVDFETQLLKTGKTTLTFICQPQRFRVAGNNWVSKYQGTDSMLMLTFWNLNLDYDSMPEISIALTPRSINQTGPNYKQKIFWRTADADSNTIYAKNIYIDVPGSDIYDMLIADNRAATLNISSQLSSSIIVLYNDVTGVIIDKIPADKYINFELQDMDTLTFNADYAYPIIPRKSKIGQIQVLDSDAQNANPLAIAIKTHTWTL